MPTKALSDVNLEHANALRERLQAENGYLDVRVLADGTVAALCELLFTRAIILGCTDLSWERRFCFSDKDLATQRFSELQSVDDEPAGFIARR